MTGSKKPHCHFLINLMAMVPDTLFTKEKNLAAIARFFEDYY
jgi:hypothetical protein